MLELSQTLNTKNSRMIFVQESTENSIVLIKIEVGPVLGYSMESSLWQHFSKKQKTAAIRSANQMINPVGKMTILIVSKAIILAMSTLAWKKNRNWWRKQVMLKVISAPASFYINFVSAINIHIELQHLLKHFLRRKRMSLLPIQMFLGYLLYTKQ